MQIPLIRVLEPAEQDESDLHPILALELVTFDPQTSRFLAHDLGRQVASRNTDDCAKEMAKRERISRRMVLECMVWQVCFFV